MIKIRSIESNMHHRQKILLGTILSIIVLFSGISYHSVSPHPFTTTKANFEIDTIVDIEPNAQRLSLQLDDSDNRHFIYLTGERPRIEPDSAPYNGTHILKYGTFIDNVLNVEDVTNDLVFPYHYDLRVDSLGQVHLAYIANNFTLYYTIRNPTTGTWTTTQLNTPSEMWALMPGITLGTNEQPRIVYSVRFNEDADVFFNQEGSELLDLSSLFYAVLDGSTWLYFDIGDNHATSIFEQRNLARQRIYTPGIKIKDGFAYIAFTNKVALAVESRMQYIKIPEIPNDTSFLSKIHQRAKIAPTQVTTYRRPSIHLIGNGVLLAFGAWFFGGVSVAYLTNSSALPDPNPSIAEEQWETELLIDLRKLNRQIDSVSSIEQDGTITVTYSMLELINEGENKFSHDVFVASFTPNGVEIGEIEIGRVTDTYQIHHYSPNIAATVDDELIILYITEDEDGMEPKLIEFNLTEHGTITESKTETNSYLEWNKTYGGIGGEEAYALIQTSDGGFALAGYTQSIGAGLLDMWLVKTDTDGNVEWDQTYGGTGSEIAYALIQTSDGGFALAGYTQSIGTGLRGIWLVKTDNDGNVEWDQTYDDNFYSDQVNPLIQTSDGGFAMIHDEGIMKIDVNGTMEWNQIFNGMIPTSIIQTADGGFAMVDRSMILKLVKTDGNGTMEWFRTYERQRIRHRTLVWSDDLIQTADEGFLISASTSSFGAGGSDMWLVKTDFNGTEQWNQTYGGVGSEYVHALIQTVDGGYALVGSTNSLGAGGFDMWLVKLRSFDSSGNGSSGNGFSIDRSIIFLVSMILIILMYTLRIRKRKHILKS